jgi:hypothetical protein
MILGYDAIHNEHFEIPAQTLSRHLFGIGMSGTGKTTFLANLIAQDCKTKRGWMLIDPHGDLAEDILDFLPKERLNDVIWIDPTWDWCPIVNIFHTDGKVSRDIAAANDLFKNVWPDAWLARSSWFFKKCARILANAQGQFTIGEVVNLIEDPKYRAQIHERLVSGRLKRFLNKFNRWPERFQTDVVTPVLNKSEEFVDNEFLAALTGRRESSFSMRWAMDNNKIVIRKFPRGLMGKEASMLACSIMLSKVNNAGLARADTTHRADFTVYVDEAGTALRGVDVPSLMSESRKYGLRLVFLTQTCESIREVSKDALASILGNSGTVIVFTIQAEDAEYLDQHFYGKYPPKKYVGLQMRHMMVNTLRDGSPSEIIELIGRPKPRTRRTYQQRELWTKKVKETSKRRFAVSKEATIEKIDKFLDSDTLDTHMDTGMDTAYRRRRK